MLDRHPNRVTRAASALLAVAALVGLALGGPVAAVSTRPAATVAPSESPNLLDHPIVDLALLDPAGPDDVERLLVVDAVEPAPGQVRLAILQRDRAWTTVSELVVELRGGRATDAPAPWLVRLGPTTFALLRNAAERAGGAVAIVRTDAGPGANQLEAGPERRPGGGIDDAGVGDVDGDGIGDLILGRADLGTSEGDCPSTRLTVLRGPSYDRIVRLDGQPGLVLLGGAIGSWDDTIGDDLLAYAYRQCEDRGNAIVAVGRTLTAVRLLDGASIVERPWPDTAEVGVVGAPLRLDIDGVPPDELLAVEPGGLMLLDPSRGWVGEPLASVQSFPIASGAVDGGARVAWVDLDRRDWQATARIERDPSGDLRPADIQHTGELRPGAPDPVAMDQIGAVVAQGMPTGWFGGTRDVACPDLLLPGSLFACGEAGFRTGASWVGTHPVAVMGDGDRRRLLVAAGLGLNAYTGLPASPRPWAVQPAGAWRHGPSTPFALAELRAADATYYRDFPDPRATIERTSLSDASTNIPGFTGARVFTRVESEPLGRPEPDPRPELDDVFGMPDDGGVAVTVARVDVPPGLEAGRDGGFVRVDLSTALQPDGRPSTRWVVRAVPINDWGEVGNPVAGLVIRDAVGPSLVVDTPFMTPVWPFTATLRGNVEPGAVVRVDGGAALELDRRGRFEIPATLAPWPQTIRVTATDPSGNATVREVSVIGGVDYRRFPWGVIVATVVLAAVIISGLRGARRMPLLGREGTTVTVAATGVATWRLDAVDDDPVAEIEDLPPGAGLP